MTNLTERPGRQTSWSVRGRYKRVCRRGRCSLRALVSAPARTEALGHQRVRDGGSILVPLTTPDSPGKNRRKYLKQGGLSERARMVNASVVRWGT